MTLRASGRLMPSGTTFRAQRSSVSSSGLVHTPWSVGGRRDTTSNAFEPNCTRLHTGPEGVAAALERLPIRRPLSATTIDDYRPLRWPLTSRHSRRWPHTADDRRPGTPLLTSTSEDRTCSGFVSPVSFSCRVARQGGKVPSRLRRDNVGQTRRCRLGKAAGWTGRTRCVAQASPGPRHPDRGHREAGVSSLTSRRHRRHECKQVHVISCGLTASSRPVDTSLGTS